MPQSMQIGRTKEPTDSWRICGKVMRFARVFLILSAKITSATSPTQSNIQKLRSKGPLPKRKTTLLPIPSHSSLLVFSSHLLLRKQSRLFTSPSSATTPKQVQKGMSSPSCIPHQHLINPSQYLENFLFRKKPLLEEEITLPRTDRARWLAIRQTTH